MQSITAHVLLKPNLLLITECLMKGDAKIIQYLNQALTNELTAINQYFLHAKMFKNWGFEKLAKHEYE